MVDSDLKLYTALYLKNAQEELESIRSFINQDNVDVKTVHRVCHTLKGQSFFMGFNDIGLKALELETYFRSLLDNNQNLGQKDKINIIAKLDEIEKLIIVYVIPSKEGIQTTGSPPTRG